MASVAVFCSASQASVNEFAEPARELTRKIVESGFNIVYGGSDCGLMGVVAEEGLRLGAEVRGVIPTVINEMEIEHPNLTELIHVADMHERKKRMFAMSEAVVVLPGGLGTLDELIEGLTWRQLGIHQLPFYLLKTGDFWNHFLDHFDSLVRRDLMHGQGDLLNVFDCPQELVADLKKKVENA